MTNCDEVRARDSVAEYGIDELWALSIHTTPSSNTRGSASILGTVVTSCSRTHLPTSNEFSQPAGTWGPFRIRMLGVSHLCKLAHFLERDLVEHPLFMQTAMGILGGIGPDPEDLMHMQRPAQRLFGSDWEWSVLGAGAHQIRLTTMGLTLGSHVRVGLENIPLGRTRDARPVEC